MLQALQVLQQEHLFVIEIIDIDEDNDLVAQFDELVPVLFARKGDTAPVQLCHYFLNEIKVGAFLRNEASD